jgi:alpha-L-arabinofuranosidase
MKNLTILLYAMLGVIVMGAEPMTAAAAGAGRGAQQVTPQLPAAPALAGTPVLEIKADQVKGKSSPILYGLMTEEINYSYDGGLYAELIRNRNFKESGGGGRRGGVPGSGVPYWNLVQTGGGTGVMELDSSQPLNDACNRSLKLTVNSVRADQIVGVSNEGFWGMAVRPNTKYRATVWAKGGNGFTGPLTLALCSGDGKSVFAQARIDKISDSYQKYEATLTTAPGVPTKQWETTPWDSNTQPDWATLDITAAVPTTKDACFQIWAGGKGTVWFSLVSLFPPTFKDRPNGLRPDIMQMFVDMKARFLRFPGGNYLEGSNLANRWNWKATVGDISQRPGHNSPWGYWSSDGLGLLEYLEWCEDVDNMEPVMGIYSGYSLDRRAIPAGEELKPYVQDALDQIEYTIGDASTKWGAQRVKDGHPAPFKLTYVEIGNEETRGQSYEARYNQFRDAIKAKYPNLKVISSVAEASNLGNTTPDVQDDHHYMSPPGMLGMWNKYDSYDRKTSPPLFLGEWATRLNSGSPITPNLEYGLCDGVAAIQFERNSDLILMQCYAPLLVNVNPGGNQWTCNLIGYDVLNCYGGVSYHVLKLFGNNYGDTILAADAQNGPTREVPMRGPGIQATDTRMRTVPRFYYDATRDSAGGTIYVKVVNPTGSPLPLRLKITGVAGIEPAGQLGEVKGTDPLDLNTITEREKIVSTMSKVDGLGADFTRTFAPYSANVLILKSK